MFYNIAIQIFHVYMYIEYYSYYNLETRIKKYRTGSVVITCRIICMIWIYYILFILTTQCKVKQYQIFLLLL